MTPVNWFIFLGIAVVIYLAIAAGIVTLFSHLAKKSDYAWWHRWFVERFTLVGSVVVVGLGLEYGLFRPVVSVYGVVSSVAVFAIIGLPIVFLWGRHRKAKYPATPEK